MRPYSALLASCALAACHSGSGSDVSSQPAPVITNLGLAAEWVVGDGALRIVAASEEAQGADLDIDGDANDLVAQVIDLARGTLSNSRLAIRTALPRGGGGLPELESAASDSLAVFVVSEAESERDLDEDGELDFELTYLFDARTGLFEHVDSSYLGVALAGDLAAFVEFDGGPLRLRVFDARDGSLTTLPGAPRAQPFVRGRIVAWMRAEVDGDLNGDGDAFDDGVLQFYDADTGVSVNSGLATDFGLRFAGGHLATHVSEFSQGGQDFDHDGFLLSKVFATVDTAGGGSQIPDLVVRDYADPTQRDPEHFLLLVRERSDRNGDGDAQDTVIVIYDPRTGAEQDTGLASRVGAYSAGRWIGVPVYEGMQGNADIDGDQQTISDILHVYDTQTGAVQNLGFEGHVLASLDGHLFVLRQEEDVDWNGDADTNDLVLFDWSARTRAVRNLRVSVTHVLGSAGESVLFAVSEAAQSADLDGDGDTDDLVLALYDGAAGRVRMLGLATDGQNARLSADGAALLVPEEDQGADLNGDGDQLDLVLHTLAFGAAPDSAP